MDYIEQKISDLEFVLQKINDKIESMRKSSGEILSTDDENDFFKQFHDYCSNAGNIDKSSAQKTFFDKIKSWYKKLTNENKNISIEEFKFFNEESKLLAESICSKEDFNEIKNIFSSWKKEFILKYKEKFAFDLDYLKNRLNDLKKITSEIKLSTVDSFVASKIEQPKIQPVEIRKIRPYRKPTSLTEPRFEPKSEPVPESKPEPTPEPKLEPTLPKSEFEILKSGIENLGIKLDEEGIAKIKKYIDNGKTKNISDLIDSKDAETLNHIFS